MRWQNSIWEDFVAKCNEDGCRNGKHFLTNETCPRCKGKGLILVSVRMCDLREYAEWMKKNDAEWKAKQKSAENWAKGNGLVAKKKTGRRDSDGRGFLDGVIIRM